MEWLVNIRGVVLVVAPIGFFFQRDLPFAYLVSVDNTTWFIAYWLFLPMAIWYAIEKFEGDSPSSVFSELTGNIESFKSSSTKKAEREVAAQREREFIKEEVAKSKANDYKLSHQKQKETVKETKEDKLKKLKDLYDKELISKEVYEKQQLEILSE